MATLCAILIVLSLVGAVVSVVQLVRKKARSKIPLIACVAVLIVAFVLMPTNGGSSGQQASPELPATSTPAPVPSTSSESESTEPAASAEPSASEEESGPLMSATVFTADVMNGFKTEVIGTRAYIIVTKEKLSSVSEEDFSEFANTRVQDSGYNWYSIICDDGTGITFAGSFSGGAEYGKIDNEGCITETIGYITLNADGVYTYEKAE